MKLLNRAAFAVLPKQPFVDWANSLEQDDEGLNEQLSLAEHREEGTVYLIDEVEEQADFDSALAAHWGTIFENELAAWDEFGDQWPQDRNQQMFDDWFEVQPQVMAIDLAASTLMTASLND